MSNLIDWTTPTLSGSLTIGDCKEVDRTDSLVTVDSGTTAIGNKTAMAAQKTSNLRASVLSSKAVSVAFHASNSGETTLKLYNLKGNVVSTAKLKTTAGTNYSHTFNTGKIPNGFYLIDLHNNGKIEQTRVVIPK
jgi:hypothetical protein